MAKKEYICKECGRSFPSAQALGGHMAVHTQIEQHGGHDESFPAPANGAEECITETEEVMEGEAEQIRGYLDQDYTYEQLVHHLGFNKHTVRQEIARHLPPAGKPVESANDSLPVTVKGTEVITPEAIMRQYLLADGKEGELMLKGMMILRAAQMMNLTDVEIQKGQSEANARMVKPILDMMIESRKEQDAAAQRARESNMEIAARAAYEAAMGVSNRVLPEVQGLKSAIGGRSEDPIARMMSMMQSAQTMMRMFGMPSGMMPGGGQPGPGPVGPQLQQPWEPPPVERRRAEEWEE